MMDDHHVMMMPMVMMVMVNDRNMIGQSRHGCERNGGGQQCRSK
jgi:hypothetical protein